MAKEQIVEVSFRFFLKLLLLDFAIFIFDQQIQDNQKFIAKIEEELGIVSS